MENRKFELTAEGNSNFNVNAEDETPKPADFEQGEIVYLCDNDADADRLAAEGSQYNLKTVVAQGGLSGWNDEHSRYFHRLNVVICARNDERSIKLADDVAGTLTGVADSVKLTIPSESANGTVSDWLDAGYSVDDFLREVKNTPIWQPHAEKPECSCTDTGNAERLCHLLGGRAKWNNAFGWCWWDGTRWQLDQGEQLLYETKRVFKSLRAEAAAIQNSDKKAEERKGKLLSWAEKSEDCLKRQRTLTLMKSEPAIRVMPEDFDQDIWLINTENELLDLSRLKNSDDPAIPRTKDCMVTHKLSVLHNPEAECPRWEKFISEIFSGRKDIIEFVQKMAGYVMTGETREQCIFILHGNGRNGKSTLLNVLDTILGPLSRSAAIETFCTNRGNKIPEDRAMLRDARLVKTSEVVDSHHTLDLGFIKDATGGENLSGRFLYKNTFEYKPQFKVFMACNVKPRIPNMDYGTWRRIRLIPFDVKFDGSKDNRNLKNELLEEKSGIMNWMIEGCRKWQKEGLKPPRSIKAATESYRNDADSMGEFFENHIVTGEGKSATAKALKEEHERYCRDCSQQDISSTAFGRSLAERGFTKKHTRDGVVWHGLEVKKN